MGAPPAPPWDMIFFVIHEEVVLAQFGDMLQLYRRFIDNVLGIWVVDPDPAKDHRKWTTFTSPMQDYYGLELHFRGTFEDGEFYGYDDLEPQGSDHHIAL